MGRKLIIDGSAVYEIDEECMVKKKLRDNIMQKQDEDGTLNREANNYKKKDTN